MSNNKVAAPNLNSLDAELVNQFHKEAISVRDEEWFKQLSKTKQEFFLVGGLVQEAGEALEVYKKNIPNNKSTHGVKSQIREELGDTLWHIANVAELEGFTLLDVMIFSMIKFREKYPHRFNFGNFER